MRTVYFKQNYVHLSFCISMKTRNLKLTLRNNYSLVLQDQAVGDAGPLERGLQEECPEHAHATRRQKLGA